MSTAAPTANLGLSTLTDLKTVLTSPNILFRPVLLCPEDVCLGFDSSFLLNEAQSRDHLSFWKMA
jgi:hypothetical protein